MVSNKLLKQRWTIAPPAFDSGQRPWELGLPAICRAPAVGSGGAAGQVHRVGRLCWRFAPDRRQAELPRPTGRSSSRYAADFDFCPQTCTSDPEALRLNPLPPPEDTLCLLRGQAQQDVILFVEA